MGPLRVFITGASSGLGAALAAAYGARGAALGLLARREDALKALAAGIGGSCQLYAADVRDRDAVARAAADFVSRYDGVDIVVANAGVSIGTSIDQREDVAVLKETLGSNVVGLANTIQPFVAAMRAAGAGKIVGIASVAGYRGLPGSGAYCASKAAAISYLESARVELRGSGVDVLTVSPGYIDTPMTEGNPYRMPFILSAEEAAARIVRLIDAGRAYAVVPWQMAIVARALRVLPNALYDRIFARAPRKPRRSG